MKKNLTYLLKFLGILVGLLIVLFVFVYLKSVNYKTYPVHITAIENNKIDTDSLAHHWVSQMTLEEKIDQMYGEKPLWSMPKLGINFLMHQRFPHVYAGKNKRLNIPPWVLSDGPRGARVMDPEVAAVTTFPVAMARGASWDVNLEREINETIAIEMRANGANYAATPCINLLRHPGWGRAQETYGEDPWLLGAFGVAAVQGIEKHNVMACPKHFALNSIENSRWVVDVELEERTLREVYLPHFKKVIQEGKPASIMSAYNQVRGDYCGSNKELLTDILREDWGFEGFVTTDWVAGLYDGIAGVQAGLDVEMPWQNAYSYKTLTNGIQNGSISESQIDNLVLRSLKTRLKYAYATDEMEYSKTRILDPKHIELARKAAEKSMVLIKNEGILPFSNHKNKTIAVIGSLAAIENTGDHGSSDANPPYVITPLKGIQNYHQDLGNQVVFNDGTDLDSAKKLAESADEVILVVGFTYEEEGEYIIFNREDMLASAKANKLVGKKGLGGDRENLQLRQEDQALVMAVAEINPNTVVTYLGGSAITMTAWEAKAPAILFAWYPGMEGGNALANILYGKVNPSGKLPFTIAQNEADYPFFNPYIDKITYGYYHGYTLLDKENKKAAYPFGHGLSYTVYKYSDLKISKAQFKADETINISVQLANTGERAGEEVVQLYIGFENASVDRPVKLLRGFKKINIEPGEKKEVPLTINPKDLAWYNPETAAWEVEAMPYSVYVGGTSDQNYLLKSTFEIQE